MVLQYILHQFCTPQNSPVPGVKPGQGSTKVQLNPPSKLSLTIDDIILYPIDVSGPSESNHLSFKPEVRNDIVIRFIGPDEIPSRRHDHFLHDIELLDEDGREYMPHN